MLMEYHTIRSLSDLLSNKRKLRCSNNGLPTYSWTMYFKSDYTFTSYNFKKYLKSKGEEKITEGYVRNELLCSMITLHKALYEISDGYAGQSK